jgi:hypothetical protein
MRLAKHLAVAHNHAADRARPWCRRSLPRQLDRTAHVMLIVLIQCIAPCEPERKKALLF